MSKYVCIDHFSHPEIIEYIESENNRKDYCSYCNHSAELVISIKKISDYARKIIEQEYELFENSSHFSDGYNPYDNDKDVAITTFELIEYYFYIDFDDKAIVEDMAQSINEEFWAYKHELESPPDENAIGRWSEFCKYAKHIGRYTLLNDKSKWAHSIFEIGLITAELDMHIDLPVGSKIIRARQHTALDILESFSDLTSTPNEHAIYPNRMSPAGISMFYGSFDKETAFKEVFNLYDLNTKDSITFGEFEVEKELTLLNLSQVPEEKLLDTHLFQKRFLNHFASLISKPIKNDGLQHLEYIPTQVLTEYFRYVFKGISGIQYDGIMYKSSKVENKDCLVLFLDHEMSKQYLKLTGTSRHKFDDISGFNL
ncbi:RES domain-containing protein [Fulvivirga maritima]|uniref:HEPN-associated N-terminal domain-containing protein n=1 Tax=Fulvivirga maritima TaxID=2904247 RepID=UPI001F27229A|nr:HEPN-associated N-terminal domain-containing protein [Fulvivirga maritima]UII28056.1 RES domain-containing protein [Fulvivirga maritima]